VLVFIFQFCKLIIMSLTVFANILSKRFCPQCPVYPVWVSCPRYPVLYLRTSFIFSVLVCYDQS
jgi:hypothetical protein